jgi:hypothetical protein
VVRLLIEVSGKRTPRKDCLGSGAVTANGRLRSRRSGGEYAQLLAEKGNLSGLGDYRLRDQAAQMVLGNLTKFNGNEIAVPQGMEPMRFPSLLEKAVQNRAAEYGAPAGWADKIGGYQLREIGGLGSGRYGLMTGNMQLVRPDV